MRHKVVVLTLFCAVLLTAGALRLSKRMFHADAPGQPVAAENGAGNLSTQTAAKAAPLPKPAVALQNTAGAPAAAPVPPAKKTPEQVKAAVEAQKRYERAKVDELMKLAMMHDAPSRDAILKEMTNSSARVRQAALEAAIQLDDRSVIPSLTEIAEHTEDAREKVSILDAIDYIKLPSLTEYREQMR